MYTANTILVQVYLSQKKLARIVGRKTLYVIKAHVQHIGSI